MAQRFLIHNGSSGRPPARPDAAPKDNDAPCVFPTEDAPSAAARDGGRLESTSFFTYAPPAPEQVFVRTRRRHARTYDASFGISPAQALRLLGFQADRWRKRARIAVMGLPVLLAAGLASTLFTKEKTRSAEETRPAVSLATTMALPTEIPAGAAAAPPVSASPGNVPSDISAVESLLARYRAASAALDVDAIVALWPSVDANALGNTFSQLQMQKIDFDPCQITFAGPQATVECGGTARFVPTGGRNNSMRVESRHWTFYLLRANAAWIVEHVESR